MILEKGTLSEWNRDFLIKGRQTGHKKWLP